MSKHHKNRSSQFVHVVIEGMTCQSCEMLIERAFKKIPGVKAVAVDSADGIACVEYERDIPSIDLFREALEGQHYLVKAITKHTEKNSAPVQRAKRPTGLQLIGFFSLAVLLMTLLTKLGIGIPKSTLSSSVTVSAAFVFGLVAALSACAATVGGLLISSIAQYREEHPTGSKALPSGMFVIGRVVSYAIFGGLLGALGSLAAPSPFITGTLVILAAFYMSIMGLDMLHICPVSLKRLLPRMPKNISHMLMNAGAKPGVFGPFIAGVVTFFIPCGFTQALQLYVLTSGSFISGALIMGAFALGTAPVLFALGYSFNLIKGKLHAFIFQFSGALLVLMGLTNIQNGFTITGHPLSFPSLPQSAPTDQGSVQDGGVTYDGKEQTIRMNVAPQGYSPNTFTIRAGVPTKWIVDGTNAGGCISVLVAPSLGIQKALQPGENTFDIPPQQPGTYTFSCPMGMYRGQIAVVPNS